jgi:hypothetical protein
VLRSPTGLGAIDTPPPPRRGRRPSLLSARRGDLGAASRPPALLSCLRLSRASPWPFRGGSAQLRP